MRWVLIIVILISSLLPIDARANNLVNATFVDTEIRQAIYDISGQTGVIVIPDSTVEGFVTLELKGVPFERALDMLLSQGGYVYSRRDGYYLVGSPDIKNVIFNNISKTFFYKPEYVTADVIKGKLGDSFSPFVKANSSLNLLSITAPASMMDSIVKKIRDADIPGKSIFVDVLYVKESYGEINKIIPEDWKLEWDLKGETEGTTGELYFKDMKLGFIYSNNLGIDAVMDILKSKSDTLQTARSKLIVLEDNKSDILIDEETYRQFVIENYTTTVEFSTNIEMGITSRMEGDRINIDLDLIASYIDGELRKSVGSTRTSIVLKQDEIAVLGGVVNHREISERYGVFHPYIPTEEKSEDSFTIFIYAKEIPLYLERDVLNIIESSTYSLSKVPVRKEEQKGLVISGGPTTILDPVADNIGKTSIRSGLEVDGSFPLDKNTVIFDGIYLEDGLKSLRLGLNSHIIGSIEGGFAYRLARNNSLSIDSLNIFLEEETYPSLTLALKGKVFFLIMKDNMIDKTLSDIGVNLSASYRISDNNTLRLEYFRTLDASTLSSIEIELETRLSRSLSFTLGYDMRESMYQDNIISNSYGRGLYIRLDYNL
ncbi:MAG TPA: hypothetical protein PLK33_03130 [bacterium]|nr:hypothetical protein [Dictyoglomota bacterium]HOP55700.1 hypothetical protein [bacterium]HPO81971.1 hypothetical protein [bacterium]